MDLKGKIRFHGLEERIVSVEKAVSWIKDGMTIGLSGFASGGDAKVLPLALAEKGKKEQLKLNVYTGASLGQDIDNKMAEAGIVAKRMPFQSDRIMRRKINEGEMLFFDQHLSHSAEWVRTDVWNQIDYAIIEAVAITEDGLIIPSTSVGNSPIFIEKAKAVIIELNTSQPAALEGFHDVYDFEPLGERQPIPLTSVGDRIGKIGIPVDMDKIKGIVLTDVPNSPAGIIPPDEETQLIADHLIGFLRNEIANGRLTEKLPPLQSGVGSVANAVMNGLLQSEFTDLDVYSEVLQDAVFNLIDVGKVRFASGCSFTLSEEKIKDVFKDLDRYRDKVVLRAQELSNNPEIIRRLGLIAINTALEVDIYGNVNSTHVQGSNMMNGIGGSGDFARNARYSIFVTKSIARAGDISSVVPFVSHVDHTEHDVDVIVTEQGYADLRGLAPRERAVKIIENCAHPSYKQQLMDYFTEAVEKVGGHTPHMLDKAFSWHINYAEKGTMLQEVKELA